MGGPGEREMDMTRLLPPQESWGLDVVGGRISVYSRLTYTGSERACWARNDIPDRGIMWQGKGGEEAIWSSVAVLIMNLNICIGNHS